MRAAQEAHASRECFFSDKCSSVPPHSPSLLAGGQVYEIPLGGTCVRQQLAVGGSGSSYIMGFIDASFRTGMSKDEALAFVRKALSHAMARDGSSGGVIRA